MSKYEGKYLIAVGTNKAGTTSLFNYLSYHDSILTTNQKQLNYFLSPDYQLAKKTQAKKDSFIEYFEGVEHLEKKYLLDVSPDYMYDTSFLKSLKKEIDISRVKVIFILRNPINRLKSWYKYGKQIDILQDDISLSEYLDGQEEELNHHMAFCAKKTGIYIEFIKPFFEAFNSDQIYIGYFEELRDSPLQFMKSLMRFLDLPDKKYYDYKFEKHNQSVELKKGKVYNLYSRLRTLVISLTEKSPLLKTIIDKPGKWVAKTFKNNMGTTPKLQELKKQELQELIAYFASSVKDLELLTNKKVPWKEFNTL